MRQRDLFRPVLAALALSFFWPAAAQAHLVTTGLGPLYDGIGHFCLSLDDVIPVLALALLAGLRGAAASRSLIWLLPLAWFLGGLVGLSMHGTEPVLPVRAVTFLVLGILIALDAPLPQPLLCAAVVLPGLFYGWCNGVALAAGSGGMLGLLGIAAALFVCATLLSASVVAQRAPWTRIVVRVAGSWTAALGLLSVGWFLHLKK